MKICAIICEFNPLHNGHQRLLNACRAASGADAVLCLMSGNFVQRGEPAILDKFTRARLALEAGADIVLELPTVYALSPAEKFAFGAVKILAAVPEVTHLCFGSESGNLTMLEKLAGYLSDEPPPFKKQLSEQLAKGATHAAAKTAALLALVGSGELEGDREQLVEALTFPNNLLGLEYLKAMKQLGAKFTPLTVKREAAHGGEGPGEFAASSAIRKALSAGGLEEIARCVPGFVYETLAKCGKANRISLVTLGDIILYRLRTMAAEEIAELYDVAEGLENRIKLSANYAAGYGSLIDAVKTKRYTHARLRRIMLYAALGVTKKAVARTLKADPYARALGVRRESKEVLSALAGSKLTLLTRREDYEKTAAGANDAAIRIDLIASDVYALLNSDPALKMGGRDFTNGLIVR